MLKLSKTGLSIARNEIFARRGYIFSDRELQSYFYTKQWYEPKIQGSDFDADTLNKLEHQNLNCIQQIEAVTTEDGSVIPTVSAYAQHSSVHEFGTCYHIPAVENVRNADSVNNTYMQMYENDTKGMTGVYRISFALGQKDHVASLVAVTVGDSDMESYNIRNFSAVTGKILTDEDILYVFGLTEAQCREMIREELEKLVDREEAQFEYYSAQFREATLSEENIDQVQLCINADGNLCFVGWVHVPAGSGRYCTVFGPGDNLDWYTCQRCD